MSIKDLDINIRLGNIEFKNDIFEESKVNTADLEGELEIVAEKYAYYSTIEDIAIKIKDKKALQLEVLMAKIDEEKRIQLSRENPTIRITEKMVDNMVKTDPRYIQAKEDLIEAETNVRLARTSKLSMQIKKESAASLNANQRKLTTDFSVSARYNKSLIDDFEKGPSIGEQAGYRKNKESK